MSHSPIVDFAPKVSQPVFIGFIWLGTSLASILLVFRLAVRYKTTKKFGLDDLLVVLAWLMLLTASIMWAFSVDTLYEEFDIATGKKPFVPAFLDRFGAYMPRVAVWTCLFYTSLWCIKLSFLIFFKQLGPRTSAFKIWWWFCLIVTILTWPPCIGDIPWSCIVYPIMHIIANCSSPESIRYVSNSLTANCVLDVGTDLLVISLPIIILWPLQLPWRRKALLMGIFSATIFNMVIAIIRIAVVIRWDRNLDMSWLYLWTNIEMSLSVMIACVGSFRQLFVAIKASKGEGSKSLSVGRRAGLSSLPSFGHDEKRGSNQKWPRATFQSVDDSESERESAYILPLQGIQITRGYSVSNIQISPSLVRPATSHSTWNEVGH